MLTSAGKLSILSTLDTGLSDQTMFKRCNPPLPLLFFSVAHLLA